uniref:Uncharacterized protein LOC104212848 n=1 Tax=Nicotiana sylvestris TaxID=4096 RepID=A0A1U7VDX4_NICSY|nr:PREDICTED: uncharacterized protein LOC104212848 [Nicotiana sylvestris]
MENQVVDHLSRLEGAEKRVEVEEIVETFPDEHLLATILSAMICKYCKLPSERCIPEINQASVLQACHVSPFGFHFGGVRTAAKVLELGFYWSTLFKDAHFWLTKWVEAVALPTNDVNGAIDFLRKNILIRFGTPREIINDAGTHLCNRAFAKLLEKYGVCHKVATL